MNKIYQLYPKRSGHAFVKRMIENWTNKEVIEIENVSPRVFLRRYGGNGLTIILQLRSFRNWICSYAKVNENIVRRVINRNINWWFNVAKEFYGETNYLENHNVVRIYYDRFFADRQYREDVCQILNGQYSEEMLNVVKSDGKGSSFSGVQYNGKAQQMNVLNRYNDYPFGREIIQQVLSRNDDLKDFCKRWDEIYETQ